MAWIRSDYDFLGRTNDDRFGIVVIDRRCRIYKNVMRLVATAYDLVSMAHSIETLIWGERPDLAGITAIAIRHDIDTGNWLIKCVHPSFVKDACGAAIRRYPLFQEIPPFEIPAGRIVTNGDGTFTYTGPMVKLSLIDGFNNQSLLKSLDEIKTNPPDDDLPTPVYVEK